MSAHASSFPMTLGALVAAYVNAWDHARLDCVSAYWHAVCARAEAQPAYRCVAVAPTVLRELSELRSRWSSDGHPYGATDPRPSLQGDAASHVLVAEHDVDAAAIDAHSTSSNDDDSDDSASNDKSDDSDDNNDNANNGGENQETGRETPVGRSGDAHGRAPRTSPPLARQHHATSRATMTTALSNMRSILSTEAVATVAVSHASKHDVSTRNPSRSSSSSSSTSTSNAAGSGGSGGGGISDDKNLLSRHDVFRVLDRCADSRNRRLLAADEAPRTPAIDAAVESTERAALEIRRLAQEYDGLKRLGDEVRRARRAVKQEHWSAWHAACCASAVSRVCAWNPRGLYVHASVARVPDMLTRVLEACLDPAHARDKVHANSNRYATHRATRGALHRLHVTRDLKLTARDVRLVNRCTALDTLRLECCSSEAMRALLCLQTFARLHTLTLPCEMPSRIMHALPASLVSLTLLTWRFVYPHTFVFARDACARLTRMRHFSCPKILVSAVTVRPCPVRALTTAWPRLERISCPDWLVDARNSSSSSSSSRGIGVKPARRVASNSDYDKDGCDDDANDGVSAHAPAHMEQSERPHPPDACALTHVCLTFDTLGACVEWIGDAATPVCAARLDTLALTLLASMSPSTLRRSSPSLSTHACVWQRLRTLHLTSRATLWPSELRTLLDAAPRLERLYCDAEVHATEAPAPKPIAAGAATSFVKTLVPIREAGAAAVSARLLESIRRKRRHVRIAPTAQSIRAASDRTRPPPPLATTVGAGAPAPRVYATVRVLYASASAVTQLGVRHVFPQLAHLRVLNAGWPMDTLACVPHLGSLDTLDVWAPACAVRQLLERFAIYVTRVSGAAPTWQPERQLRVTLRGRHARDLCRTLLALPHPPDVSVAHTTSDEEEKSTHPLWH